MASLVKWSFGKPLPPPSTVFIAAAVSLRFQSWGRKEGGARSAPTDKKKINKNCQKITPKKPEKNKKKNCQKITPKKTEKNKKKNCQKITPKNLPYLAWC